MSGYHDIVIPGEFSVGSTFAVGYDTRITTLESGIEERLSRYTPAGRRRYTLLRGIAAVDLIQDLLEFYILRQGALNSFKFEDRLDYSTSSATRTNHRPGDVPPSAFDQGLVFIPGATGGRTYQLVTRYIDSVRTIVRNITKVQPGTAVFAVNGGVTLDFTLDEETGQVTFGAALGVINTASGGCLFYVPVRFSESTDEAFTVAMQAAPDTNSLPGFELVEDLSPSTISQDYQYGGAQWDGLQAITANVFLTEASGRVKIISAELPGLKAILPSTIDLPLGGPIFVVENSLDSSQILEIVTNTGVSVTTLAIGRAAEIYLGAGDSGSKLWFAMQSL